MIFNFDERDKCKSFMDRLQFESPFVMLMPEAYEFHDDGVDFIYSDLGISKPVLEKLLSLKVVREGKTYAFDRVDLSFEHTGEYEFQDGTIVDEPTAETKEIINKYLVVNFR